MINPDNRGSTSDHALAAAELLSIDPHIISCSWGRLKCVPEGSKGRVYVGYL
jgi:hypothetical protein